MGVVGRAAPQLPTITVVVPAKNEETNLPLVLPRIPAWVHEVILVDGNSTDGTVEAAARCLPSVRVVTQRADGKGDALRTGFELATGDIIVMLDADGSTDPSEIPAFVGALLAGADFAKGSRFMEGGGSSDISFIRRLGNWGFTTLVRLLFGHRFTDLCYGYNAFWRSVAPRLTLDRDGFEIETLMNIRALRARLKVVEVASFEYPRVNGTSRLRPFRDGWRVLQIIARERFSRRISTQLQPGPPDVEAVPARVPSTILPVAEPTPEVVVLCGGQGTRLGLGPMTELMPKPLVKVAGQPVLHHIMSHYARHGLHNFTLCLGYGGDMIRDYFLNYSIRHRDFSLRLSSGAPLLLDQPAEMVDWKVTCVETGYLAQTGARIHRARRYVEGPYFLCTYGDGLTDVDIRAVIAFHRRHGRLATVTAVRPPYVDARASARFGELDIAEDGRVLSFAEKPRSRPGDKPGYINGGFFVFNTRVFDYLSEDEGCTLERGPLDRLAAEGELFAFQHDGFWHCMDTLGDRDLLEALLNGPPAAAKVAGNGHVKAASNGHVKAASNGHRKAASNGHGKALSNGRGKALSNGQAKAAANGQAKAMSDGHVNAGSNGHL